MHPILIAECCQNHNGSRETLKRMIHAAVEAGADYVKIQAIRSRELTQRARFETGTTGPNGEMTTIKRPYQAEFDRLSKLDLSLDDEAWFVEECQRAGIGAMTTVFTRTAAREVKDLGYDAVKIASYDCSSFPLLKDIRRWWSTIFCSTGASYDNEVEQAAAILAGTQYSFLHCVTIYPTPLTELHLRRMSWLHRFTPNVGFSDHTAPAKDGLWATKIALALGATCVERHFTILAPHETKDGPVSINPNQLSELRAFANRSRRERMAVLQKEYPQWTQALGYAQRSLSAVELMNRDYYRGRFASKIEGRELYNWEDVVL